MAFHRVRDVWESHELDNGQFGRQLVDAQGTYDVGTANGRGRDDERVRAAGLSRLLADVLDTGGGARVEEVERLVEELGQPLDGPLAAEVNLRCLDYGLSCCELMGEGLVC